MRRGRVNSRQKRWWTSNRGVAKVGRASRPEYPESVYIGRPRARRLGPRPANDSVAAAHAICDTAAQEIQRFCGFLLRYSVPLKLSEPRIYSNNLSYNLESFVPKLSSMETSRKIQVGARTVADTI